MSAADILRKAADLLEQRSQPLADHGSWRAETDDYDEDEWVIATCGPTVDSGHGKVMFGGQWTVARDVPENVARWASTLGPQVAGPLAAWLRVEADLAENPMCVVVEGAAKPLAARVPETAQPFALAMARAILGEVL